MSKYYVGIMAGGIGSRFWPLSRSKYPKQFLDILGTGESLLQSTFNRFKKFIPAENIYFITSKKYVDLINKQIPGLNKDQILAEPARRNTAPCVAYFSNKIYRKDKDAVLMIAPSDHIILNGSEFENKILLAASFADNNDCLITLGIQPSRPDTGYGYIQYLKKEPIEDEIFKVKTFTEKPPSELAKTFLASGDFLWNAGIFVWSAKSILESFEKHCNEVAEIFNKEGVYNSDNEKAFIDKAYGLTKSISIDYAIMENAQNVLTIPSSFGWSDLGTWRSLFDNLNKDENSNAITARKVMNFESKNCLISAPENKMVVLVGVDDYYIVDTEDVLLICKKNKEQEIKSITNEIKATHGDKYL